MRYLYILLLLLTCCKDNAKTHETSLNNNSCLDTLTKFKRLSEHHYPTSYYDDKKLMNLLRYMMNSNCDSISTYASTNLFFSNLIQNNIAEQVDFNLNHLTKLELQDALLGLNISSKERELDSSYLLGVLYLNGKYVKKDSLKGIKLLSYCSENLDNIQYSLSLRHVNTENLDSLYYIPKEYKLYPKSPLSIKVLDNPTLLMLLD